MLRMEEANMAPDTEGSPQTGSYIHRVMRKILGTRAGKWYVLFFLRHHNLGREHAMQAVILVRRYLKTACASIHATREAVLFAAVDALIRGGRLTVTGLGRTVRSKTTVKHAIKRMDRLLSNGQLHGEREQIQAALIRWTLGAQVRPIILVDWSDLTADRHWQLLRTALPVGGRTLTLYEEVHPLGRLTNPQVHRAFLRTLHRLVPPGVTPIVVTDAGFRAPWFREVERRGWTFVGRVRHRDHVRFTEATRWVRSKSLYDHATATPKRLGRCELVESHPLRCQLVLVKEPGKHRIHRSRLGHKVRSSSSRKHAACNREPWLLAVSEQLAGSRADQVVACYRKRMQIEESFRDLKDARFGVGLSLSHTTQADRFAILLLIAALAQLAVWLVGHATVKAGYHWRYQANTTRHRLTCSVIALGLQVARRAREHFTRHALMAPLLQLQRTPDAMAMG